MLLNFQPLGVNVLLNQLKMNYFREFNSLINVYIIENRLKANSKNSLLNYEKFSVYKFYSIKSLVLRVTKFFSTKREINLEMSLA